MIRIGIAGYGNLGRGVERALAQAEDMRLEAVFTRRDPGAVTVETKGVPVLSLGEAEGWQGRIDVIILCGGSAADLPQMTPALARHFHVVDSFDTHGAIPDHYAAVDEAAMAGGRLALISAGWDPGLFSLLRLWGAAFLPAGEGHTFWGPGVSQGHSDALRRIGGVADGRQYTVPIPEEMEKARRGASARPARETHRRVCFVAAEEGADKAAIEEKIRSMPHYFAGYDTSVTFLSPEELAREHGALPHGGRVIRGATEGEGRQIMEFSLSLTSNPRFTGGVLAACARGVARQARRGAVGCITMADLAPADLIPLSREALLEELW